MLTDFVLIYIFIIENYGFENNSLRYENKKLVDYSYQLMQKNSCLF